MTLDETIKRFEALAESYEVYVESINPKELAEWLTELKEAKRLLKAAVDDVETLCGSFVLCFECPLCVREKCACKKWRYKAEVLKLLKED